MNWAWRGETSAKDHSGSPSLSYRRDRLVIYWGGSKAGKGEVIETPILDTAGVICLGDLQEEAATGSMSLEVMERLGVGMETWGLSAYGRCPIHYQQILSSQTSLAPFIQLHNKKLHTEMRNVAGRRGQDTWYSRCSLFTDSIFASLAYLLKFIRTPKINTCRVFSATHKGVKL